MEKIQKEYLDFLRRSEKRFIMTISGDSMSPGLKKGDRVVLEQIDARQIKIGNIVVYQCGVDYIIHRIIKIDRRKSENRFCEKGDNLYSWKWFSEKDLIGVVNSVLKEEKRVSVYNRLWPDTMIGCLGWCIVTAHQLSEILKIRSHILKIPFISPLKSFVLKLNNKFIHITTNKISD